MMFTIEKKSVIDILTYLKELEGFTHLVMLSSVDWLEENKFQLTYIINHPVNKHDISIRVFINRDEATMDSIHHIWIHAETDQRETIIFLLPAYNKARVKPITPSPLAGEG